jgi:methylenetetrahydrofolate reductase (NADPH)
MTAEAATLLRGYSVEVTAHGAGVTEVARHLPAGTEVYIAFTPRDTHDGVVAAAVGLRAAGFELVPHVTARTVSSLAQLDDFLARLAGEAGVSRALALGGDADPPAGPYPSALALLEAGRFERHGIGRVGLACYPEGHPRITAAALEGALAAKLARAREAGLAPWLISQFCFEAAPIVACAERLRAGGIDVPLRVGLAGPADLRRLWRYGRYCGIGPSLRALGSRVDAVANLLARRTPEPIVTELAAAQAHNPALGIAGIHLFTFGDVGAAAMWANALLTDGTGLSAK